MKVCETRSKKKAWTKYHKVTDEAPDPRKDASSWRNFLTLKLAQDLDADLTGSLAVSAHSLRTVISGSLAMIADMPLKYGHEFGQVLSPCNNHNMDFLTISGLRKNL